MTPAIVYHDQSAILLDASIGPATRCNKMGHFPDFELPGASETIADHRRPSPVSPKESQQCGQSATHDGMSSYSPAIVIAAMAIRNI